MPNLRIYCGAQLDDKLQKLLIQETSPHQVIFPRGPVGSVLSVGPVDLSINEAEIIIGQPEVKAILQAERLRWLHITSAGFTRYDTAEFRNEVKARGFIVTNSSNVYAEACAEHVFAFMLAAARQLPTALLDQSGHGSGDWAQLRNSCFNLRNQEVVILGYGTIAARLIEMLAPFRMKITAMRRQPRGDEGVAVVRQEDLAGVLATADHVVNILPENGDSIRFVGPERLQQMKRGSIFYNIGRGGTVDQEALAASLHSGHIGAAWLDVTAPEPLPEEHPLRKAPRCYITPHIAGGHTNEAETQLRHFLDNFQRFLKGTALVDRIM